MDYQDAELVFINDTEDEQNEYILLNDTYEDECNDKERELTTYSYINNGYCYDYFVGYEIGSLIGYKNPAEVIKNNVSKSNKLIFRDYPGDKIPELDPRTILINRDGAIEILLKTRKRISPNVLNLLKKFGIETTNKNYNTKEKLREDKQNEYIFLSDTEEDKCDNKERELNTYSYINNGYFYEYFVGYEITSLLGYKDTNKVIRNNVSKSNQLIFRDYPGVKTTELDPRTILITRDGVVEILVKTRKHISPDVLHLLNTFGIESTNKNCITKEQWSEEDNKDEEDRKLTTYSYVNNGNCFEYFVGYEITALLGYKSPKDAVTNNVSKSNQLIFRDYPGVKIPELDPRTILITRNAVVEILLKTRKRISNDVLYMLRKFGIETTNRKCLTKEQQTLSHIASVFKTEKFEDQFKVGSYYLDMYFTDYKIVIECDENGHNDRKPGNERDRMDFVNFELNIDNTHWIRYNPDEYDFDMMKVIGRVHRKIDEIKLKRFEEEKEKEIERIRKELENYVQIEQVKMCCTCREEKPLTEFNANKGNKDGLERRCKLCRKNIVMNNRIAKEKIETPISKICPQCKEDKLSSEYYKNINRQDKLNNICKDCTRKMNQKIIDMPKIEIETKKCSTCNTTKTIENFHKRQKSFDGYSGVCKSCTNERMNKKKIENNSLPKIVIETKECSKCEIVKNKEEFFKCKRNLDGYNGVCKSCLKEDLKNR